MHRCNSLDALRVSACSDTRSLHLNRKGTAVQSGQQLASQLLQELRSAGGAANGAFGRLHTATLQHTAMAAAEARMRSMGLEVYWQRIGGGAAGVQHSGWDFAGGNATAASGTQLRRAAASDGGSAGHGGSGGGGSDSGDENGTGIGSRTGMSSGRCANLYGVLRSPRGDGKEGLVLATPVALAAPADRRPGAGCSYLPKYLQSDISCTMF